MLRVSVCADCSNTHSSSKILLDRSRPTVARRVVPAPTARTRCSLPVGAKNVTRNVGEMGCAASARDRSHPVGLLCYCCCGHYRRTSGGLQKQLFLGVTGNNVRSHVAPGPTFDNWNKLGDLLQTAVGDVAIKFF